MNGYEVCRRIRENEATALVPVVMVTSHDSEARIDGIRAGACDEPAAQAVRLALEMRDAMGELTATWRKRGHELDFSLGVALGYATIGRIGFEGRYDYGAVGSVPNLASRLCDAAPPGQIVVSRRVLAEIDELVEAESLGPLDLKGFGKPVEAFAVTGTRLVA